MCHIQRSIYQTDYLLIACLLITTCASSRMLCRHLIVKELAYTTAKTCDPWYRTRWYPMRGWHPLVAVGGEYPNTQPAHILTTSIILYLSPSHIPSDPHPHYQRYNPNQITYQISRNKNPHNILLSTSINHSGLLLPTRRNIPIPHQTLYNALQSILIVFPYQTSP
jgi:hypothetical protein